MTSAYGLKKPTVTTKTPVKVIVAKPKPVVVTNTTKQQNVDAPVQVKDDQLTTAPIAEQARALSIEGQAIYSLLVDFSKRLEGIPYLYAGNTMAGFNCSGFIYLFHSFIGRVRYYETE